MCRTAVLCRLPANGHVGDYGESSANEGQGGEKDAPLMHPLLQDGQDANNSQT